MKKYIAILVLFFLFFGCKKNTKDALKLSPLQIEEVSGQQIWNRIAVENDFHNYDFWPGHEGEQPGQSPHGIYHLIYINSILKEALPVTSKVVPNGSIIVKENCDANREAKVLTVMVKVKGYDPENNDWYWIRYGIDGSIQAEGKVKGCINCHKIVKNNDYIFVRKLDKSLEQ
ncbi:MAG: cytochrome P460 family protein [Spirochaetes bacterium]|nr:cytochrome P460 family protein [Spirochaetota bacterium]